MAFSTLFDGRASKQLVNTVTIPWTTDASGNYSETITGLNGVILLVVTDPGAAAPTDNWDMTLTSAQGFDAFNGRGADRDTANTEGFCPLVSASDGTTTTAVPIAVAGDYTFAISGGGNAKTGTTVIYLR